ncbi:hypothetical protein Bbelb_082040 [Branchiostoma belcheri]|nr:hypothetical protein Bbelb_082040 [Branchiostoma belcheri]
MTSVVLLDYSAAFDLVDHTLLLRKLTRYGFSEEALSWTKSYLSKRNWQVYANGAYSKERLLQCGVPQGSCLGPQLYSIYVNDMSSTVENGELDQYADDSTVHAAGHTVQDIRTKALVDLECVAKWSDHNMLKLNNDKTKAMLVGTARKTRLASPLQLELRGQSLQQVPTVKLLGVQVDQNLTFDDHIDPVVKKCNRSMAQVSRVRKSLLPKHRIELIQALVLTHLDYCSSVWASTSAKNIKRLQVIQNRAARLALGCDRYTSKDRLLEKLGWLPVKDRVHQKGLRTFNCSDGYTLYGDVCYKVFKQSKSHHEASTTCSRQGTLGRLAMAKDEGTNDFLTRLKNDACGKCQFHFGLNDTDTEGKWKWVDGSDLRSFDDWAPDEPDDGGGWWCWGCKSQDCAVFKTNTNGNKWDDRQCSKALYFICEMSASQPVRNTCTVVYKPVQSARNSLVNSWARCQVSADDL